MELHTFKLPMNYTNQVLEAFCHPTSTRIGEADCMLIYNHLMHAIGIIDLTHQRPLKQIKLKLEGENRIGDVRGIFSYKDDFILRSSFGFHRIDGTGNILSSWSGDHYLKGHEELKEYSIMIPELMTYFNLYNFAGYDECNGLTTFSIYKNKKENGEYPKKILVVDCHTCEVVDVIDVFCPERMKQEPHLVNEGLNRCDKYMIDAVVYACASLLYNMFERYDAAKSFMSFAMAFCNGNAL